MYNSVEKEDIEKLSRIAGGDNCIILQDALSTYSHDETQGLSHMPEVVLRPVSAEQISGILSYANERLIPVTPRGGGTGLSGGAVPSLGGIVISFEKLNNIIEIDPPNMLCMVQPGVITEILQKEAAKHGLFYPPDPASLDSCTIGGNIAEGAGGARTVKYGTTGDYVMGLEVVLPTGEILKTGGKAVKDVTGYNLTKLMVGSEGTLPSAPL